MLRKELGIFTFKDLLEHFPNRHIDKTKVSAIKEITATTDYIQVVGSIIHTEIIGEKRAKRLIAQVKDATGVLELVWFQGIHWIQKNVQVGKTYLIYGKVSYFSNKPQITHPELESIAEARADGKTFLEPIYPTTEKLKAKGLNARQIGKLTINLLPLLSEKDVPENIPQFLLEKLKLVNRFKAYNDLHFPKSLEEYTSASKRLKFEELFIAQIRLNITRIGRNRNSKGVVFEKVGEMFNAFYSNYLPFELTAAQKRVLKEIRNDTAKGRQMNRLLQGDVGSGKTIVSLLAMLLSADNGHQSCMMAPTEILAQQHYNSLQHLLKDMPLRVALLTGSTKQKERKEILRLLLDGSIKIVVGTHAIIEDAVQFKSLGLAIVDEQHRFGVAQRAKLWTKAAVPPHILVMTATPIPRTLAMTAYGDLDYSIMDELPPGRLPVTTVHRYETFRAKVMDFLKTEIEQGRQAYVIYPLIEESEKMSYEDLMQGYEQVKSFFPEPRFFISMLHGRQTAEQKDINMKRFVEGQTHIMVSTTVIEVGVNVPNATVMVIESAEKFGLSQLHQLRGRVGRGNEKSFCILLTGTKISTEGKQRIHIMCNTSDGFKIAEKDLELRGPGDIEGTKQSGLLNFKLASLVDDKELLIRARQEAEHIIENDADLEKAEHKVLKTFLFSQQGKTAWSKIS
jgi:ATP-dependent DNA helicase RecG